MKSLFICLLLFVAVKAADWSKIKPLRRSLPPVSSHPAARDDKILGGVSAREGQLPHQIGVYIDGTNFCGGSLITDQTVLTAAHCVFGSTSLEVHAGALNLTDLSEEGRVIVTTSQFLLHENFNEITLNNDLAIIFLPQPISGPNIGAIRLPSRSQEGESFFGKAGRASGWGYSSKDSTELSDALKYTTVNVIDNRACYDDFGFVVTDCHVCTSSGVGTIGVCTGDLGGALTVSETDGVHTQIGIASFLSADGCATHFPHVYARVTCYLDWLEQNTGVDIRP